MEANFSLLDANFTPVRPRKVERLFTPNSVKNKNDMTYQVAVTPSCHLSTGGDKYPTQSTGLVKAEKVERNPLDSTHLSSYSHEAIHNRILNNTQSIMDIEDPENAITQYRPFYRINDTHPIRATCFHPTGDVFVVGLNSKNVKLCIYPSEDEIEQFHVNSPESEPKVAYSFQQTHKGSTYCASFNDAGNLLATGSNDQTVQVIKYNTETRLPKGTEYKLAMHTGTVRDLCFLPGDGNPNSNSSSQALASAGAGKFEIYITDCSTMKPVRKLVGHKDVIMSLARTNDPSTFYSASLDGTIRLWDSRSKLCCKLISTMKRGGDAVNGSGMTESKQAGCGTPVGVVRVEESGRLLASGHIDGRCMLFDIRGDQVIQLYKAHDSEIRTLNFSPKSYYLLTGGYDHKVKLTDLQGNLGKKLPSVEIANLSDKVVQTAWHPDEYSFVTTSANGLAILWVLPDFIKTFD